MEHRGYIELPRATWDILADEESPLTRREAFVWLLLHASWEDRTMIRNNQPVVLERGQLIKGYRELAEAWQWSKNKVARFLDLLTELDIIGTQIGTLGTTITIRDYGNFGGPKRTRSGTPTGHPRDTHGTPINEYNQLTNKPINQKTTCRFSDADLELAKQFVSKIRERLPEFKKESLDTWANDIRLMRELDCREHPEIWRVFEWSQGHHFWHRNILSPSKLRKQWDRLVLEENADKSKPIKPTTPADDYVAWAMKAAEVERARHGCN